MTLEDKIQESYPESYPLRTGKLTGEYRSLFLSDIHLATKSCKARHLNKFLKQAEGKFEEVYIIGDFIDMINFRHKLYFDSHHMDVLRRLLFKIPKEGAKVRYIPGNHDLYFRPFIEDNPGEFGDVDIINSYDYRSMDGKRYKITHGDEFDVFMKPEFFWLSRLGNAAYDVMVLANQALNWTREKLGL
ncbi:MAG: UDP-2,3-diacylglucosamine diphosphatase, partial [Simkania sp.]|nr:UDP-2,3-diacylglucosamine diphosphatase [Simkania sp.]